MSVVAIIGAGDLGGALASKLASRDRVNEVRLIDRAGGVAAGKALDILQAGPIERSGTRVSAAPDVSAAAGATVIVIADDVGPPIAEIQGEAGLALIGRVRAVEPRAPIVCAGAAQAWLVAHAVAELNIPATRIVGSAPLALVSALRALVALERNGSPKDVSVTLAGTPPSAIAVPWQTASMHGESLEALLDAPALRRLETRLRYLWPPGPYALAAAAAQMIEGLIAGSRQALCGFTADRGGTGGGPAADDGPQAPARPLRVEVGEAHARDLPALSPQQRVTLDALR